MRAGARILAVALAMVLAGPGTWAQGAGGAADAKAAAADLRAAIAGLSAARRGRDRVAALSAVIRAHEAALSGLRDARRRLTLVEAALTRDLAHDEARVGRLLGALAGIEAARGTPALLHPAGPLGSARAGALLAEVTPALAAEAAALRARLDELAALRAAQTEAADMLQRGLVSVQTARVALSQAIAERTDLPMRLTESRETLARLAEGADALAALTGLLADMRVPPEAGSAFDAGPQGALPLPVAGVVVRGFAAGEAAAVPHPGLSIATEPGALVTAPTAATLRFAGPLAGYGNVVILEPADGVLLVLAGLGALFGQVGAVLPAGAPVGLMGGEMPDAAADRAEVGGVRLSETLYMELRTEGAPTDPAPWFAERAARAAITTGEPTGP